LPDVTFARDGSLSPVTAVQALVGAVGHFTPNLDVYAYAGLERDNANFSSAGGTPFGLGNPAYLDGAYFAVNSLAVPSETSSPAGNPITSSLSNTTCSVNVKQLEEITVGFWQNLYKGDMGRIAGGAQFEYIHRTTFPGALFTDGPLVSPAVDQATVLASLRYYFP
jgi:hypothetical protein